MKEKIILTDADGVLLNWLTRFDQFMAEKGYVLIPGTEALYTMSQRYDIKSEDATALIKDYNKSRYISDLDAYKDSVEYIAKLVEHGFKFVVITSISSHPDASVYRTNNLKNLFGDIFTDIICLETGGPKDHVLKHWEGSGLFWIEDHIKNAEVGYDLGLKSVLVQQDHNAHYETDHFHIVGPETPWKEIYNIISKDYSLIH